MTNECRIRWDEYSDATADPSITTLATCVTHGVVGKSDTLKARVHWRKWQREQALARLREAHRQVFTTEQAG